MGDEEVAFETGEAEHRVGWVAQHERELRQRDLGDRGAVRAVALLEGDEAGEGDFGGAVGVEVQTDCDVAGGRDFAGTHVEADAVAAADTDFEAGCAKGGAVGLEVDDRGTCRRSGLGLPANRRGAGAVDFDYEVGGADVHPRNADQADAVGAGFEGEIARGVGPCDGFEERQAEVEVADCQARRAGRLRNVLGVDVAVVVGIDEVRPADPDEGADVGGADGQDADRLGDRRCVANGGKHDGLRRAALGEFEVAAYEDVALDAQGHVAESAQQVGRGIQGDGRGLKRAGAVRVETGLDHHAALGGEARASGQVERLGQTQVVLAAVDLHAQGVGADGDAVDADHFRPASGRNGVVAAAIHQRVGRLEQGQPEGKVAQYEAHRAVRLRRVLRVDDAVIVGIDEVRPADADKGVDVRAADGHHVDLLGGVAAGDLHGLRCAALRERELARQVQEVGDRDRDVAGDAQQVALGEIDDYVLVRGRTSGRLEAECAAEAR